MKKFAQFLAVACIGLLSWQEVAAQSELGPATVVWLCAGALAAAFTLQSNRLGYTLDALVGGGYLAQMLLTVRRSDLLLIQPMLLWSVGLALCGAALLWDDREPRPSKPLYERHPEY